MQACTKITMGSGHLVLGNAGKTQLQLMRRRKGRVCVGEQCFVFILSSLSHLILPCFHLSFKTALHNLQLFDKAILGISSTLHM